MNYFIDVAVSAQRDLADAFDYIDLNLKKSLCCRQAGCHRMEEIPFSRHLPTAFFTCE